MSGANYKDSGVNIDEGNRFVTLIKKMVEGTHSPDVLGGLGGFAGFYSLNRFKNMRDPVLVSSTDGVGTKLKVAIDYGKFNTVGIDLVAMSANDLIVTGAIPLFFLDYIATGKLSPEMMHSVVSGIVSGCEMADMALLGGETAEMPGLYAAGDFDLAGFAVGILDRANIIDGSAIKEGDVVVGLASSGFHSNGYSLIRKIFFEDLKMSAYDLVPEYGVLGDLLLTPTRIYVKSVHAAINAKIPINGMVHITGGGFYDNIPRVLPRGIGMELDKSLFPKIAPIEALRSLASTPERELHRVFNMGVGYIFVLPEAYAEALIKVCTENGDIAQVIGRTIKSDTQEVIIKGIDA
ncbi:MAG: phosphoribosylformylglycinamidine cyclo-ligase [Deferribacteraceae bacterium]|jgi:phosphoribosylformylglycinamidine cyclo-ligase|nr:phosphoribosylformylglycinamidine cyclo-ligase [Deferribacteraceae bacterium]